MFALKEKEQMVIIATTSGEEVGIFYRDPTPKEFHKYQAESVQRKRNKVIFRSSEAQYKYGAEIMTGLREGDFGVPNEAEELVGISSTRDHPLYKENWKETVCKYAPAIVIALGQHVFGGTEALDGEESGEDAGKD